ncbi:MAG: hypothetical protein JXQ23_14315 [Clostridia bacterium]|nr:hypothetical protein [Clostridia bacterium]
MKKKEMIAMIVILTVLLSGLIPLGSQSVVSGADDNYSTLSDDDRTAGVFYFNPSDSRIFVERRLGLGFTLNFGNPLSYVIFFIITALIVVIYLKKRKRSD